MNLKWALAGGRQLLQAAHIEDAITSACGAWSDVRDTQGNLIEWKCELAAALEQRLRGHIQELRAALSTPHPAPSEPKETQP